MNMSRHFCLNLFGLSLCLSTACLNVENELNLDADGDGETEFEGDCDDSDPALNSQTLWARDADLDGFGSADNFRKVCLQPGDDWIMDDTSDCDDSDPNAFPGAAEWESDSACMRDADGDGWGDVAATDTVEPGQDCDDKDSSLNQDDVDADGYTTCDNDCDDNDADLNLDDADQDGYSLCDGDCNDEDAFVSVEDLDGDGFSACGAKGSVDCDDTDAYTFPGAADLEENGADYCMTDLDGDGWGDAEPGEGIDAGTDCHDANHLLNQNDDDGDTFTTCDGDCVDSDEFTFPGAAQSESGSACMTDSDDDGYGEDTPADGVTAGTDCNDVDESISPAQTEVCDSQDNDCNGLTDAEDPGNTDTETFYYDGDGDGYGLDSTTVDACEEPSGYTAMPGDCDDGDPTISPGATEICDLVDNDCDDLIDDDDSSVDAWTTGNTYYLDADEDGFGHGTSTYQSCQQPDGFVTNNTDCDDGDADINPAAEEMCDEIDNDCDGDTDEADAIDAETYYLDADEDGDGNPDIGVNSCEAPSGYVNVGNDCDDSDSYLNSLDADGDGYSTCDEDCDDEDSYLLFYCTYFALQFDGSNDYVNLGQPSTLEAIKDGNFTIEAWVRPSGSSRHTIIVLGDELTGSKNILKFFIDSDGSVGTVIRGDSGTVRFSTASDGIYLTQDNWHHVAVVREYNSTVSLYVDGVLASSESDVAGMVVPSTTTADIKIGAYEYISGSFSEHFSGNIVDVRFWNLTKSTTDISTNMSSEVDHSASGLAAYYLLTEGSGSTTPDATGGASDGTIVGANWEGVSSLPFTSTDYDGVYCGDSIIHASHPKYGSDSCYGEVEITISGTDVEAHTDNCAWDTGYYGLGDSSFSMEGELEPLTGAITGDTLSGIEAHETGSSTTWTAETDGLYITNGYSGAYLNADLDGDGYNDIEAELFFDAELSVSGTCP